VSSGDKVFGDSPNLTLPDKRRVQSFVENCASFPEGAVSPCIWKHTKARKGEILVITNQQYQLWCERDLTNIT
jgi:hypothetical protein